MREPCLHAGLVGHGLEVCWITDPDNKQNRDRFANLPGVRLLTIHSAKGLEFRAVVLVALDQFPDRLNGDPEKDANLLYVGLTRATERLFVTWVGETDYTKRAQQLAPAGTR